MKIEITNKQLISFYNHGMAYVEQNNKDIKLTQAIHSVLKQIRKYELIENYNEAVYHNQLTCCAVDPGTGVILKDKSLDRMGASTDKFMFSPENQMKLNALGKELLKETVTLSTRIIEEEVDLNEFQKEAFSGLVIPALPDEDDE